MTLIYGHRGARGEAPENTLAGFRHCLAQGVSRCELDLHLCADGELMVIHDPTLRRTTGRRGRVSTHSAAQLEALDARRAGPDWPHPCPIPRLRSLFAEFQFEHWQLEVKSASPRRAAATVQAIARLVAEYALEERVVVTSSSRTVLRALQQEAPHLARGLVSERAWLDPVRVALRYGCQMLVLNWTLCSPQRLRQAQQAELHVSAWTVNEPALMRRLAAIGVESLITDFPGLATATLRVT